MKVDHYSFSKTGGAGRCAELIADYQRYMGFDSQFHFVVEKNLKNVPVALNNPLHLLTAITDEYLIKSKDANSLFSLSRSLLTSARKSRPLKETRAIQHFHWIEGQISKRILDELATRHIKAVWTLHDMVPFTGGCHFSVDCDHFEAKCQGCPQVRSVFRRSVELTLQKKSEAYRSLSSDSIFFVAPSIWMKNQAEKSSALRGMRIELIENPISKLFFDKPEVVKQHVSLDHRKPFVIALVAEDLTNPVKNVSFFIDAFQKLRATSSRDVNLLLIGANGRFFSKGNEGVIAKGLVSPSELSRIFDECDLLVSVSIAESAGMTIKEAAARGVPCLVTNAPGAISTVRDGVDGLIATTEAEFKYKLNYLVNNLALLRKLGSEARAGALINNHPQVVAGKYVTLYEELLGKL